ncbi:MAG: DUF1552 domain-containing protein [Planctomycetota bacterium]|nr:DUF1552 domain-containing protein [Planctomycetota bacterium]
MKHIIQQPASRRRILRGTGVALGLPLLNSLLPRTMAENSRTAQAPIRSAFLHFPNGVWEKGWVPEQMGHNYELSPILQPIAEVRNHVLVLTGLDKQHSREGDGHYSKQANFLTGMPVRKTAGKDLSAGGISVDQLMAQALKGKTPHASLVTGTGPVMTGVDRSVGYTHAYGSYLSWESESRPVTPEFHPQFVYESLFHGAQYLQPKHADSTRHLLDFVLEDARSLRKKLGRDDRHKMDEYLDSMRTIESRIEFSRSENSERHAVSASPEKIEAARPGIPKDFRDHIHMMMDLLVIAFQTDTTRVASLLLAGGPSNQSFNFIDGVTGEHHELSHHENKPEKIAQYQKISQWYVEQFVQFLQRLQEIQEGEGSLLDNCMVLFGSCMSDGNRHDPDNLPILLGGRAGGTLDSGQHIASNNGSVPLCNLYLSMLDRMGIEVDRFGDSTGRLL